jgi:signal recognition particle receptor subunit beta
MQDMWRQLKELNRSPRDIPFVLQCNKQDLADAVDPALLGRFLGVMSAPIFPAVAVDGKGTVETLKSLINSVIANI